MNQAFQIEYKIYGSSGNYKLNISNEYNIFKLSYSQLQITLTIKPGLYAP